MVSNLIKVSIILLAKPYYSKQSCFTTHKGNEKVLNRHDVIRSDMLIIDVFACN